MTDLIYAGDLSPEESWELLNSDPDAQMIDVRTNAEFSYVGVPDLSVTGKELHLICWKVFPAMDVNRDFETEVEALGFSHSQLLLFLCRSGVRSRSAAHIMTIRGYTRCYNVLEGFEGDKCPEGRRGSVGGWKVAGLPWHQK